MTNTPNTSIVEMLAQLKTVLEAIKLAIDSIDKQMKEPK